MIDFNQTWSQEPLTLPQPVIQPAWGQRSCRGHRGQKGHFTKNATPPTDYRIWSCDSCTCISLTLSTKVMGLKIHLGSFEVTGVKRSFSPKMLLLLQITWHGYVTHAHSSPRSLYQSYGYKNWLGVIWGHRGQNVIFTKNAITYPCYIAWLWDSYMLINLRPSTYLMGSNVNLGSFGVNRVIR